MTETSITQNAPILMAIDIAKARHEFSIAIPDKKRRRRVTNLNQLDDFSAHLANLDTEAADPGNGNRSIHIAAQARPSFCSWNMERAVQFG